MLPIFLPGLAGQESSHDALEREHLGSSDQHGSAVQIAESGKPRHGLVDHLGIAAEQRPSGCIAELSTPKGRHGGEDPALVGDGFSHHHVKGADPVRGHHQEPVFAEGVELADLAGVDGLEPEVGEAGSHQTVIPSRAVR